MSRHRPGISFAPGPSRPLSYLRSVAVDPRTIPEGSHIYIPAYASVNGGWFEADDTGGAIIGRHIDVFRPPPPTRLTRATSPPASGSTSSPRGSRCPDISRREGGEHRAPRRLYLHREMSTFDAPVTIRHVRYANEQTGWAVLDAAAVDGQPVALVGPLVHLEEGERAHVVGSWVTDSRYGSQVKVSEARPLAPDDPEAVIAYLRRDQARRGAPRGAS